MKLNKTIIILIVILFSLINANAYAQDSKTNVSMGGIYLNFHDYAEGKLSAVFNCNSKDKIILNDFLSSRYVDITVDGKKTRFNKDSIFGYRNCKNETYRFYKKHDEEFRILESKGVVLYLSYIKVSSDNGKINKRIPAYFFSKTKNSEILPLTMQNLKQAFPDNIKFHDLLDIEFGNGEPLSAYSASEGMYKINHLLTKSNQ